MQYQPSANEKASHAQSSQLPNIAPRIHRSQSANDAAAGVYASYMYGDTNNPDYNKTKDPRYYYGTSGAQTYTDAQTYPYDAHNAYGYHQYAAEQAPTDEAAAYHQYHAQAAMQHAQQQQQQRSQTQQTLSPIYDHHQSHNFSYHNTGASYQTQPSHQTHSPPHHTSTQGHSPPKTQYYQSQQHISPQPGAHVTTNNSGHGTPDIINKKDEHKHALVTASDDKLPTGPTRLQYAATTGFYVGPHAPPQPASTDLRYELEQIQNKKNAKRFELENKRKTLIDKNMLSHAATKQLEETKKKWNVERETIIKTYGGKMPSFVIESDALRKDLDNMSNRNSALQASLEVISNHLQTELYQLQYQLKVEKEITDQTHEHNIELERRVRELRIEKLELETELKTEQDKLVNITPNNIMSIDTFHGFGTGGNDKNDKFKEYPPESTVIQNLLQAQVEFYFSDYNLKRDKRLLSDVVKPPKKGFLRLEEVMKLSRIRQLCSEIETLEEALRRSTILTLVREEKKVDVNIISGGTDEKDEKKNENKKAKVKVKPKAITTADEKKEETKAATQEDEKQNEAKFEIWVGRINFEKPREKEFPFRRTVFIFGIPTDGSEPFLHEMLAPFGTVSKIQFDHSPDGIDRKIGIRFLNKPRVYTLYYYDPNRLRDGGSHGHFTTDDEMLMRPNREQMIFKTSYDLSKNQGDENQIITSIKCHKCGKDKNVSEGFYTTNQWKVIYCAQCAAQLAEDQLNIYYKERNIPQYQHNPRHKWLGLPPNDMSKRKTALVVFASQRQASKCAYVRTRIAYKGAFATHFHHYSKVKKEIVLSESDQNENKVNNKNDGGHGKINNKNSNRNKSQSNSPNKGYKNKGKNKGNNNRRNRNSNRGQRGRNNNRGYQSHARYNNNNNQMGGGYNNYAQQQAAYYNHSQQPPPQQQQQHNMNMMKQPKIYRQNSAPTGH